MRADPDPWQPPTLHDVAPDLRGQPTQLPVPHEIERIACGYPHGGIGTVAREEHATIGRRVAELVDVDRQQRIRFGLGPTQLSLVPSLEHLVVVNDAIVDRNRERVGRELRVAALRVGDEAIAHRRVGAEVEGARIVGETSLRGRGDRGRIEPTAHQHPGRTTAQTVGHRPRQEARKVLDVLGAAAVSDFTVHRKRPVPLRAHASLADEVMRSRQPPNAGEARPGRLLDAPNAKKIGDRLIVERARHARVQPDAVQRAAEDEEAGALGVEERLDAEVVPRAEQPATLAVPDGEREVAEQVPHARLAPDSVGVQDEGRVRSVA